MKKLFVTSLITGIACYAGAQSIDIGLRGGAASTWLLNQNVSNAGQDQDYVSSVSPEFGLHTAINFIGGTGIELEFIYSEYTQNYKGSFTDDGVLYQNTTTTSLLDFTNYYAKNETMTSKTQLTLIKIPLLFHYEAPGGFSLEVGPEYGMISAATFSATYTSPPPLAPSSVSYSSLGAYNTGNFLAVLGFGWNVKLIPSGKLYLLADLRFEYSLTDIKGTDAHGENLDNYANNPVYQNGSGGSVNSPRYGSYAATNILEGSLSVGLFYRISFGKAVKGLL